MYIYFLNFIWTLLFDYFHFSLVYSYTPFAVHVILYFFVWFKPISVFYMYVPFHRNWK